MRIIQASGVELIFKEMLFRCSDSFSNDTVAVEVDGLDLSILHFELDIPNRLEGIELSGCSFEDGRKRHSIFRVLPYGEFENTRLHHLGTNDNVRFET